MKTFLVFFALIFAIFSSNGLALNVSQSQLKKLYSQEVPKERDVALIQKLTDEVAPQISSLLPDSLKSQIIKQTLNAWRGHLYIPIIQIEIGANRDLMENNSLLRELMAIINEVRDLWPAKNTWPEVVVEIYFDRLMAKDPQLLSQTFPEYECGIKEVIAVKDDDSNYTYRPCACITIKTNDKRK